MALARSGAAGGAEEAPGSADLRQYAHCQHHRTGKGCHCAFTVKAEIAEVSGVMKVVSYILMNC